MKLRLPVIKLVFMIIAGFTAQGSAQTLDAFNPNADLPVYQALKLPDGKILVCGNLTKIGGVTTGYLARLNPDGTRDTSFVGPNPSSIVNQIVPLPDGKFIITGGFDLVGGITRRRIARLNADFTVDESFDAGISSGNGVGRGALLPDGKFMIGISSSFSAGLYRLNTNGSIDNTFSVPEMNSTISRVYFDEISNKLYAIGGFNMVNGVARRGIVRLNLNGSVDTTFSLTISGTGILFGAVPMPDGKIYVGGTAQGLGGESGRNFVARLNSNGSIDTSFAPVPFVTGTNPGVNAIMVLPSGKVLIAGAFQQVGGQARLNLARLNTDGSLDTTFRNMLVGDSTSFAGPGYLNSLGDGKYFVGGAFTTFDGQTRNRIARITMSDELVAGPTDFDFDGDGKADIGVFRPSDRNWYIRRSSNASLLSANWGFPTDKVTPADFDGDEKTDIAVWREDAGNPDRATFFILRSSDQTASIQQFGRTGDDPTVVGDYTGDGKADLAIFREGTAGGPSNFFYRDITAPAGTWNTVQWGSQGDRPVVSDYDGDSKMDVAVFRPSNGVWYILQSSNSSVKYAQWGVATDRLVPADYDGDAKADVAAFRDGVWFILNSGNGSVRYGYFGNASDTPAPADYDGDGKADLAIFRNGIWWMDQSTAGIASHVFGATGDKPLPAMRVR